MCILVAEYRTCINLINKWLLVLWLLYNCHLHTNLDCIASLSQLFHIYNTYNFLCLSIVYIRVFITNCFFLGAIIFLTLEEAPFWSVLKFNLHDVHFSWKTLLQYYQLFICGTIKIFLLVQRSQQLTPLFICFKNNSCNKVNFFKKLMHERDTLKACLLVWGRCPHKQFDNLL